MWIMVKEGDQAMWIRIFVCFMPFKGQFWTFNAYLVVFGLFLPKTGKKKFKILKVNFFKNT